MAVVYGFDPSLRHGVLVGAEFQHSDGHSVLSNFDIIFQWTKRTHTGIGEKSPTDDVFGLVQLIVASLMNRPVATIAVDWDPRSIFWRSRKLQNVQLALFIGYFTRAAHQLGYPVVFVNPSEVRSAMGLKKAEKLVLQDWFMNVVDTSRYQSLMADEDTCDATILAYLASRSMDQLTGGFNGTSKSS